MIDPSSQISEKKSRRWNQSPKASWEDFEPQVPVRKRLTQETWGIDSLIAPHFGKFDGEDLDQLIRNMAADHHFWKQTVFHPDETTPLELGVPGVQTNPFAIDFPSLRRGVEAQSARRVRAAEQQPRCRCPQSQW